MKIGQLLKLCLITCAVALGLAAPDLRAQVWQTNSQAVVSNQMLQLDYWGPGLTVGGIVSWGALTQLEEGNGDAFYGTGAVYYTNALQGPVTSGQDDYVQRIWGMFIPPVTTNYVFYICSDDYSQLYLSTDMTPGNLELIAEENQWSNDDQWTASAGSSSLALKRSDQFTLAGQTTPQYPGGVPATAVTTTLKYPHGIPLVASNMYLIALFAEQGGGGDNAEATYKYEGQADPVNGDNTIITGNNIAWVVQPPVNYTITIAPSALTNYAGQEITFTSTVKSDETPYLPSYQWIKNGVNITNADGTVANGQNYTTILSTNDNNATFQLAISYTNISSKVYTSPASAPITVLAGPVVTGGLTRDYWANQSGGLSTLLSGNLPQPTFTSGLTNFEDAVNDNVDDYLTRISGWFIPPATGKYVFFISSDDASDLFISTNNNPANKHLIAQETSYATNFEWLSDNSEAVTNTWPTWNQGSQKRSDEYSPDQGTTFPYSGGIALTAGQMYYIEADHYQGGGGDDCSVTFKLTTQPDPTNGQPTAFAGTNLATATSIATNLTIAKNLVNVTAFEGGAAFFAFGITTDSDHIPNYQWIINGTNFVSGTATNPAAYAFFNTPLSSNGTTVQVIASLPFSTLSVTSAVVTLTVEQAVLVTGELEYQFWENQSSTAAAEAGTAGVPAYLSSIGVLQSPVNDGIDDYVDAMTGFFIPPLPGTNNYVFNIASDDQSDLWLSTDATAANARIIAQEANWSNEGEWVTDEGGNTPTGTSQKESDQWVPTGGSTAPYAAGIPLIGGQMYYMNVVHYQGGGGTQVGVYFWVEGATNGPYVGPPADYVASDFAPTNIAMYAPPAHAFVSNSVTPSVVTILSGLTTNFTASGGSDSAYFVNALNLTNVLYQWYLNGVAVAGATNGTFTTPVLSTNMNIGGSNATVVCSMGAIGAPWTNSIAYLTVKEDTVPPTIVSAYGEFDSGGGGAGWANSNQCVDVVFSKPMNVASVLNPANYTIAGYTVTNVMLFTNQAGVGVSTEVILQLSAPITGTFTLKANVVDVSEVAPVVTSVTASEDPLNSMDIAYDEIWAAGTTVYEGNGNYIVEASGNDIWNAADGFRYVYETRTNSFDVSVQVPQLLGADTWSKAGLMARESIDPEDGGSRMFYNVTTPNTSALTEDGSAGQNQIATGARSSTDGSAFTPGNQIGTVPAPDYPNVYLRITRQTDLDKGGTNDLFTAYYSTNNVNWEFISSYDPNDPSTAGTDTNFPSVTYIGMCTCEHDGSGDAADFAVATYQGFGDYAVHVFLTNSPESVTVHSGDTATFTVEAGADSTINTGPSLQFQWYTNGTAVPGANASTLALNLVTTNLNGTKVYCSITPIASSSVTNSATATLTVLANTGAPTVTGVYAETDSGTGNAYIDLTFNESMNIASLLNLANYTLTGATITNVELYTNNQAAGSTNQVVLRLNKPLTSSFTLGVSGVESFSGVSIAASTKPSGSVDPMTSIDIASSEIWTNGSTFDFGGGSYEVDASGNDIWGDNDGFRFVYQPLTNSFDVAVQVTSLLAADAWSKAGLMARETIDPTDGGSRMFYNVTTAEIGETTLDGGTPVNVISIGARSSTDGGAFGPANATNTYNPVYPNVWLRLTRVTSSTAGVTNDLFSAYYSNDNATWQFAGSFDPTKLGASNAFPSVVYVGMATTAHVGSTDAGDLATAFYANYGPTATNNIPTKVTVTAAYVAASKSLTISWTPAGGVLVESPVLGPNAVWTAVTPASNPVTVPVTGTAMYFKVE